MGFFGSAASRLSIQLNIAQYRFTADVRGKLLLVIFDLLPRRVMPHCFVVQKECARFLKTVRRLLESPEDLIPGT